MNQKVTTELLGKLAEIQRRSVRYRAGKVTAISPLSVTLGGSDKPYVGVTSMARRLAVGDQVSVLLFGNDLLVLGSFTGGFSDIAANQVTAGNIASVNTSALLGQVTASQIGSVNASAIAGLIAAGQIGAVNASAIAGVIAAGQIGSITAGQITGTLVAAQIGAVNASAIAGTIAAAQIGSVNATAITGSIAASQIGSVNATAISGSITSAQIGSLATTKLTGTVTAAQIATLTAGQITGTLTASQIASLTAGQITGTLTASQIGSVNATAITGSITAAQIGAVNASVIAGTIAAAQIASVNASAIAGTITAAQIGSVNAAQVNVGSSGLAGISTNMGNITAGTITGGTIIGGSIQTATSGSRVIIASGGIAGYGLDGVTPTFFFDTATGKITTLAGIGGPNKVLNSGFENGLTGWNLNGTVTSSTTRAKFGTKSAYLSAIAAGGLGYIQTDFIATTPGEHYTASYYAYPDAAGVSALLYLQFYTAAGVYISDAPVPNVLLPVDRWSRVIASGIAPAGAVVCTLFQYIFAGSGVAVAAHVDGVQLEEGSIVTAWGPKPDEILPGAVGGASGGAQIAAGSLSGTDFAVGAITAGKIAAGAIEAGQLAAGAVTAGTLAAGAVTAGTINAVAIDGMTITGATLRTSATGPRVMITSAGIKQYGADGVTVQVDIPSSGATATLLGNLKAKGIDFDTEPTATLSPVNAIRWLDTTGFARSTIGGLGASTTGSSLQITSKAPNGNTVSLAIFSDNAGGTASGFSVFGTDFSEMILNVAGHSKWLRQKGLYSRRIIVGNVTSAGDAGAFNVDANNVAIYQVYKLGVGTYRITYDLDAPPVVMLTPAWGGAPIVPKIANGVVPTAGQCDVMTFRTTTGALEDMNFSFMLVG